MMYAVVGPGEQPAGARFETIMWARGGCFDYTCTLRIHFSLPSEPMNQMAIPAVVNELLNSEQLEYCVQGSADERVEGSALTGGFARATLLEDSNGSLVAIYRSDRLLDLAALGRFTGRELRALNPEAVHRICEPLLLDFVPALPGLLDMPVVADRRTLEGTQILLSIGSGESLISLPRNAFLQLLDARGCAIGEFSIALAELAVMPNTDGDQDDIISALGKFTSRRMRKRLEDTLEFPPLPEMGQKIIQLGANPLADIKDLADIVEMDPPLSAQVVSWAASPYYAAPGNIRSVQDAIVRVLGFDLVMNLALGLALGKTLHVPRDGPYGYRLYWRQAVYCAAMMEALVKAMPADRRPQLGEAYLAGLLHNFGFLLMAELFKPQLELVCRYCEANPHAGYSAVERFLLGVTRDQLAAFLAAYWQLPDAVCTALRYQDQADYAGPDAAITRVLYVARNQLAQHGLGMAPVLPLSDELLDDLGLARNRLTEVIEHVFAASEDLSRIAQTLAA